MNYKYYSQYDLIINDQDKRTFNQNQQQLIDEVSFFKNFKQQFQLNNDKQSKKLYSFMNINKKLPLNYEIVNNFNQFCLIFADFYRNYIFRQINKNILIIIKELISNIIIKVLKNEVSLINDSNLQSKFYNCPIKCFEECFFTIFQLRNNQKNYQWEDKTFGFNKNLQNINNFNNQQDNENCKWISFPNIYEQNSINFYVEEPNLIQQSNSLGDCWLITAFNLIIKKNPNLIFKAEAEVKQPLLTKFINELDFNNLKQRIQILDKSIYPQIFQYFSCYGIFVTKFYKDYQWIYVVVDNKLACIQQGPFFNQLKYAKSYVQNEFWGPILEKSYAKLHGDYEALTSGDVSEGLMDLTGYFSQRIGLSNLQLINNDHIKISKKKQYIEINGTKFDTSLMTKDKANKFIIQENKKLWKQLSQYIGNSKVMLGCSAQKLQDSQYIINKKRQNTGILNQHAYAIIQACNIKYNDQLKKQITIRSPKHHHKIIQLLSPQKDRGKWMLKWSCQSEQYKQYYEYYQSQQKKDRYENGQDHIFLIGYKDWRFTFDTLFVSQDLSQEWQGWRFKDYWIQLNENQSDQNDVNNFLENSQQYIIDISLNDADAESIKQNDQKITNSDIYNFLVQMGQPDWRLSQQDKQYPYEGYLQPVVVCIFKLKQETECINKFDIKQLVASSGCYKIQREITLNNFSGKLGRYAIIVKRKLVQPSFEGWLTISWYIKCQSRTKINFKLINRNQINCPIVNFII